MKKIRKSLIDMLKNDEKCYLKEIAWLEKQVPANEDEIVERVIRGIAISLINHIDANSKGMYLSNMEDEDIENAIVNEDWDKVYRYMKKKLEKKDEKPQDEDMQVMKEIADFIYITPFKPKDLKKKEKWLTWFNKQGEKLYGKSALDAGCMDYEGRYKNALERASKLSVQNPFDTVSQMMEYVFPELRESSDEMVRKALMEMIYDTPDIECEEIYKISKEKCIAWLEKQGKLKSSKWTEGDVVRHGGILALVTNGRRAMKSNYEQITIQYPDEWVKADSQERKHFFEELEKQSKFKAEDWYVSKVDGKIHNIYNSNEVEPKFKVGDCICNGGGNPCKVNYIFGNYYELCSIEGYKYNKPIRDVDANYRLWTIDDAQDGDVLSYVTDELWIMIYQSLYEPYEGHVHYHALLVNDNFTDKGTCCICIDNLKPATKEQYDVLFAKMKDAGYEWDVEKKELKKTETKGGNDESK